MKSEDYKDWLWFTFKKFLKWSLIIIAGAFLTLIVYFGITLYSSGLLDSSSKEELIENYNEKKQEITELKNYFNSVVPKKFSVYIEFRSDTNIDLKVYEGERSSNSSNYGVFVEWDINPYDYEEKPKTEYEKSEYSPETKSLELVKQKLKWTNETFEKIKELLDKANCISVSNGEPSEIGFARSGMGKYSYYIFKDKIADSLKTEYDNNCENIIYNDKVVLNYGSGAIGSMCFPESE